MHDSSNHSAKPLPESPCTHCGLPIGHYPIGNAPYFCCAGCEMVHSALQHAGFSNTYYKLQDLAPVYKGRKPANVEKGAIRLAEMDTTIFLETHTQPVDENTRSIELFLEGVHCAACVWLVERLPFEINGVQKARLNLPRARLYLEFSPEKVKLSAIAQWLAQFGYATHPVHQEQSTQRSRVEQSLLLKAGICWAIAGNVMLLAFALYSGLSLSNDDSLLTGARWASCVLALIATWYGGSEFFKRAWASIKVAYRAKDIKRVHIDTPISIGILVGFGHSSWATLIGQGEIWFDSITVLIAALLTARWLQLRSRRIAGDASDQLLSMIPSMARKITDRTARNAHELIRVDSLGKGNVIEVPAGEVFPVDGIVVEGESTVNNAVLTGESRPEPIKRNTAVQAGATNINSPVLILVKAIGEDTQVGKLLAWIQSQESNKAPVVLMADKLSSYFVIGLLFLAALTAILWLHIAPEEAAQHVVALLVISCPCALGMATPLAMAIASGHAAQKGIFIKSAEAIQQLTDVDTVILDKTGTLTEGSMTLVDYTGDLEALHLATILESHSNHPIAQALNRSALHRSALSCGLAGNTRASEIETIAGQGIKGYIAGHRLAVGRPAWIQSFTAHTEELTHEIESYIRAGHTPVAVAVNGQWVACMAFGDKIRDEAASILHAFEAENKEVYILSGDHQAVVQHVACQLRIPIERAIGDASPENKQAFVEYLQTEKNKTVAMIGDGVNDAAALKTAHVGIAVQGGASPSLVAADVFMTSEGLSTTATLFQGSQKVMLVIKRNLGISLLYNLLGATAAILGLVTPLTAAIAMPLSSLLVIASSILQRTFISRAEFIGLSS